MRNFAKNTQGQRCIRSTPTVNTNWHPEARHVLSTINTPERPYLQWLREGAKKAEGRINGPACRKMYPGETIVLQARRSQDFVFGTITFKTRLSFV